MDAVKNMWNKYREWLGDKVWYKNWKVWLSIIVVLAIAGAGRSADEIETAEEKEVPQETQELIDEVENVENVEQEEPEELTNEEEIIKIIEDEMGSKLIEVEHKEEADHYNIYAKTSGLSVNMDRKGTYFNTSDVLEKIQDKEFGSLYFEYQAEFVDKYGDSEQRKGITYDLTKETVDKINFDSFLPENLPEIADSYWQHPAFN